MENSNLKTIEEVLRFAISEEQNAADRYMYNARHTTNIELKVVWEQLARDEVRHKAILTGYIDNNTTPSIKNISNFEIIDGFFDVESQPSELHKLLASAVNSEIEAINMYRNVASQVSDANLSKILMQIASDEDKHRKSIMFELENLTK